MAEKDRFMEWIEDFNKELEEKKMTLPEVLGRFVRSEGWGKRQHFLIGLLEEGQLHVLKHRKEDCEDNLVTVGDDLGKVEGAFRAAAGISEENRKAYWERCRVIGGRRGSCRIYCFSAVETIPDVDVTYLSFVEEAYCEWLAYRLSDFWAAREADGDPEGIAREAAIQEISREASERFTIYIKSVLGVDLSVLADISGSYYEGKACECDIIFWTYDGEEWRTEERIVFDQPVEICTSKVRNIRKILEMGGEGYCALAKREGRGSWKICGICKVTKKMDSLPKFSILGHMVWKMELGIKQETKPDTKSDMRSNIKPDTGPDKKTAVICQCGKYGIRSPELDCQIFTERFEKVFGKAANENLVRIFRKAVRQEHGTIVIILNSQEAGEETERLIRESTGMKIRDGEALGELVRNATAIDGAMMVDECGKCYGIGMILDSSEKVKGNPERGARFHSVLKYVRKWQNKGKQCLGVVVSEDKTVDVISVEDDI